MKELEEKGFIEGVAYACAFLVRGQDQPSMAAEIIASTGYGKADFKRVDSYDRKVIYKLFRDEKRILNG